MTTITITTSKGKIVAELNAERRRRPSRTS
jgi:hypothetical protein